MQSNFVNVLHGSKAIALVEQNSQNQEIHVSIICALGISVAVQQFSDIPKKAGDIFGKFMHLKVL